MIQATCLIKIRDNNSKIIGYLIKDLRGNTLEVSAEQLKMSIFTHQINIDNLKLTSDGKLIDKPVTQIPLLNSMLTKNNKLDSYDSSYYLRTFTSKFSHYKIKGADTSGCIPQIMKNLERVFGKNIVPVDYDNTIYYVGGTEEGCKVQVFSQRAVSGKSLYYIDLVFNDNRIYSINSNMDIEELRNKLEYIGKELGLFQQK